jgi:hypothetical protein
LKVAGILLLLVLVYAAGRGGDRKAIVLLEDCLDCLSVPELTPASESSVLPTENVRQVREVAIPQPVVQSPPLDLRSLAGLLDSPGESLPAESYREVPVVRGPDGKILRSPDGRPVGSEVVPEHLLAPRFPVEENIEPAPSHSVYDRRPGDVPLSPLQPLEEAVVYPGGSAAATRTTFREPVPVLAPNFPAPQPVVAPVMPKFPVTECDCGKVHD